MPYSGREQDLESHVSYMVYVICLFRGFENDWTPPLTSTTVIDLSYELPALYAT